MFERLKERWDEDASRGAAWTVRRSWIGAGLILLVYLIYHFEKVAH